MVDQSLVFSLVLSVFQIVLDTFPCLFERQLNAFDGVVNLEIVYSVLERDGTGNAPFRNRACLTGDTNNSSENR